MKHRDRLPGGIPEINQPYRTVAERYGPQVAAVIDKLRSSGAQCHDKPAHDFKWSIAYIQGGDPLVEDPKEFAEILAANSEVYLVARGHKWKGHVPLDVVPEQVMSRFAERARLMCSAPDAEPEEPVQHSLDIEEALRQWLRANTHDRRIAVCAKVVLAQLVASTGGQT